MPISERTRLELARRLDEHRERRWSQLKDVRVRFRGNYAYVEATLPDGDEQPLFRLRSTGGRDKERWGFAIWVARANV